MLVHTCGGDRCSSTIGVVLNSGTWVRKSWRRKPFSRVPLFNTNSIVGLCSLTSLVLGHTPGLFGLGSRRKVRMDKGRRIPH